MLFHQTSRSCIRLASGSSISGESEWSQKHLAGTAGVDQGYISRIESGQTEPCLATLAKAFGRGLAELLDGV
jgi:predicted transcriptional regulator